MENGKCETAMQPPAQPTKKANPLICKNDVGERD
jgi:hypothetical protein